MRLTKLFLAATVSLTLAACSDKDTPLQDSLGGNTVDVISNYDLGNSVLPFPNDFLFADTTDGTINIPGLDEADLSDPQVALNGLDGFSTTAPMSTGFTGAIDGSTISATSVRVYPVAKAGGSPGGAIASVGTALTFGVDYVAAVSSLDTTNSSLVILPLKPLSEMSAYAVVITNELKSTSGNAMGISGSYSLTRGTATIYDLAVDPLTATSIEIRGAIKVLALQPPADATDADVIVAGVSAQKLEGIRLTIVSPSEAALVAADSTLDSADIILHWSFTTQSTTSVLGATRAATIATNPSLGFNSTPVVLPVEIPVTADIYEGALTTPYYLTAATGVNDFLPLASLWKSSAAGNPPLSYLAAGAAAGAGAPANVVASYVTPVSTSTQTIPVLLSTPAGGCGAPCPVVIYQHGITTNRTTLFALADSMAAAGYAVIAIDMPMHGVTGNETDGTAVFKDTVNGERTFDLDLVTQDATTGDITAPLPDGVTDTSGRHFINLTNLQNSRDNVRQAVSDLIALRDSLAGVDFNGAAADGTFDLTNVKFLGHSLGGIVGTTFLAFEPASSVGDAVIAMSGGGIAKLLDGSAAFGPSIAAGLAANGVIKGSTDYEAFMGATQAVVDSGDPINHTTAATTGRGILFFEVVGGNGIPSDLVVPNRVPDTNDNSNTVPGPLSGTDPLVGVDLDVANPGLGLTQFNTSQSGPNLLALVRYNSGDHGSILSPAASLAVTTEMQTQAATFFATGGLVVGDASVIVAP
jgi:pimeloyl-ACP methyl ester carboxylesterase